MDNHSEKKTFSLADRARSFGHAGRGLSLFFRTTHNSWIHLLLLACALIGGIYFGISRSEWLALIVTAALVLSAEAFNTAIEIDIDLTSPEYHPFARDTKDVAAAAVLITAIAALFVALLIFGPRILSLFGIYLY